MCTRARRALSGSHVAVQEGVNACQNCYGAKLGWSAYDKFIILVRSGFWAVVGSSGLQLPRRLNGRRLRAHHAARIGMTREAGGYLSPTAGVARLHGQIANIGGQIDVKDTKDGNTLI